MEILGNVNSLKKSIEKDYEKKIRQIEEDAKEKAAEISKNAKKETEELISKMRLDSESEANKAYSLIISEETMNVKKKYEEKREAYINEIFAEAKKQSPAVAKSPLYIKFVKKNAPKGGFDAVTDNDACKKLFPNARISKGFSGVRFVSDDVTYDFSIEAAIESKKDVLRHTINEKLFKAL